MSNAIDRNKKMLSTVFHIIGLLLMIESMFMLSCCSISVYEVLTSDIQSIVTSELQAIKNLCISSGITLAVGAAMFFPRKGKELFIDKRGGFLIVTTIWIVFSLFGSLPFVLGNYIGTFTDAYFETTSGFTTTGASIMKDVESLPYGIGLWRIMTEWIGGIGIIVIMLSIIPFVGGGGMALYAAEVAGPTKSKLSPKIKETSNILIRVYLILTIVYLITYKLAGMRWFDAICFSFTTIATGGLTSRNTSAMEFSPLIQYLITCFMVVSGTNLLFLYYIVKGRFREIRKSEEFRIYISVIVIATAIVFLLIYRAEIGLEYSFRTALFQVVSVFTSSGLLNSNFMTWNAGAIVILIMLMFPGAMSGSTTGGMKLMRVILLFKCARTNVTKSLHSNAFVPVTLDKKMVNEDILFNIFTMFMLYCLTACFGFIMFIFTGVKFEEALVSAISMCSNIGVAYGSSYDGCFAHYTPLAKWTMSFMMVAARLELVTVFSIFTRSFWRR